MSLQNNLTTFLQNLNTPNISTIDNIDFRRKTKSPLQKPKTKENNDKREQQKIQNANIDNTHPNANIQSKEAEDQLKRPNIMSNSAFRDLKSNQNQISASTAVGAVNDHSNDGSSRSKRLKNSPTGSNQSMSLEHFQSQNSQKNIRSANGEIYGSENDKRKKSFNSTLQTIIERTQLLQSLNLIMNHSKEIPLPVQNTKKDENRKQQEDSDDQNLNIKKSFNLELQQQNQNKQRNQNIQQQNSTDLTSKNSEKDKNQNLTQQKCSEIKQSQLIEIDKQFQSVFNSKDQSRLFPQISKDQNYFIDIKQLQQQVTNIEKEIEKVQKENNEIQSKISKLEKNSPSFDDTNIAKTPSQLNNSNIKTQNKASFSSYSQEFTPPQMKDLSQEKQLHDTLNRKSQRHRRTAMEIDRHYLCPMQNCGKTYGSEGSLNQHIKLKHPDVHNIKKQIAQQQSVQFQLAQSQFNQQSIQEQQ